MDLLPEGHTFSIGVAGLQAPSASRRHVPAYLLHLSDTITAPLSTLDIRGGLVLHGGLTPATARLAIVDGQSCPDLNRPLVSWASSPPGFQPALTYPSASQATPSAISEVSAASSSSLPLTSSSPATLSLPNFGAIQVPPVVTLAGSPPLATATSSSYYPAAVDVGRQLSPTIAPVSPTHLSLEGLWAPPADWTPSTSGEWAPSRTPSRLPARRQRDRQLASGAGYQVHTPRRCVPVPPRLAPGPRSPVRAPSHGDPLLPAFNNPYIASLPVSPLPAGTVEDISTESDGDL